MLRLFAKFVITNYFLLHLVSYFNTRLVNSLFHFNPSKVTVRYFESSFNKISSQSIGGPKIRGFFRGFFNIILSPFDFIACRMICFEISLARRSRVSFVTSYWFNIFLRLATPQQNYCRSTQTPLQTCKYFKNQL